MAVLLALSLLVAAAPDAGAEDKPLTFADVAVGDWLEYEVDGKATLKLRACARGARAITVAVSTYTGDRSMACSLLLDGMLIDVPLERLKPPPELPQPEKIVGGRSIGDKLFTECGEWGGFRSIHGPNTTTVRCIAPELVLGGGLVSYRFSIFTIRGYSESHDTRLKRRGNDASACPKWPRVPLSGWWDEQWVGKAGKDLASTRVEAGSAWVRITTKERAADPAETSQQYLADALIDRLRELSRLGSKCSPTTFNAGGKSIPAVVFTQLDDKGAEIYRAVWASAAARLEGPAFLALQPLEVSRKQGDALALQSRVEALGTGKR